MTRDKFWKVFLAVGALVLGGIISETTAFTFGTIFFKKEPQVIVIQPGPASAPAADAVPPSEQSAPQAPDPAPQNASAAADPDQPEAEKPAACARPGCVRAVSAARIRHLCRPTAAAVAPQGRRRHHHARHLGDPRTQCQPAALADRAVPTGRATSALHLCGCGAVPVYGRQAWVTGG